MSYQYPPNNQVDFSWVGFDEYTYPDSTSADFSWYNYVCRYLIPTSPNIDFRLDNPATGYVSPPGGQVYFHLVCDDRANETVLVSSGWKLGGFESLSEIIHWPSPWLVSGSATLSGGLTLVGKIATIISVAGDNVFTMESSSVIDRGNWGRSNARIRSPITSQGYAEMIPIVMAAVNNIGNMTISSQSGVIITTVFELGQNMQFTDSISHLRGRVIFGYPKASIIRQVYEMSNNRSWVIPSVPEDPCYAVFLTTTDFNLTDEELRRGTVDMTFTFDHDLKDIVKISVWIKSPSGHISLDKMRIVDYPGGNQEPHLLLNPFKYSEVYRIPIHCISKKENEFFIEVEYKNADSSGIGNRPRAMLEKENYIIPFQAHFDNRMPYLNIADHAMLDGPKASSNVYSLLETTESFPVYCIPDSDVYGISQNANKNIWYSQKYEEITRIFLTPEDVASITHGGGNPNIYFIQEYVDLSTGQIGG